MEIYDGGKEMKPENELLMQRGCYYLVYVGNILLGVLYLFGSLTILLPGQVSMVPDTLGSVALGILLALTGCFGRPFFPNACPEEDGDTL
jgi:hypothetical protein